MSTRRSNAGIGVCELCGITFQQPARGRNRKFCREGCVELDRHLTWARDQLRFIAERGMTPELVRFHRSEWRETGNHLNLAKLGGGTRRSNASGLPPYLPPGKAHRSTPYTAVLFRSAGFGAGETLSGPEAEFWYPEGYAYIGLDMAEDFPWLVADLESQNLLTAGGTGWEEAGLYDSATGERVDRALNPAGRPSNLTLLNRRACPVCGVWIPAVTAPQRTGRRRDYCSDECREYASIHKWVDQQVGGGFTDRVEPAYARKARGRIQSLVNVALNRAQPIAPELLPPMEMEDA